MPGQYNALLPIFENQIREISDDIYTRFNEGTYTEFNEPVTYTLSGDQLKELNTKGELKINIWNSGKIPRQYVDCRITDISVVKDNLQISQDTILSDASLTLLMAHSGNSAFIHPGTDKGTEDGEITLILNQNTGIQRSGRIAVYAMDAANPRQEVRVIQLQNVTKVPESQIENGFNIYLNPASDEIFVTLPGLLTGKPSSISVIGLDGRVFLTMEIPLATPEPVKLSLEPLSYGIYLIEVKGAGESWRRMVNRIRK